MNSSARQSIHVMRLVTDEAMAHRITDLLFETLEPTGIAVNAFEAERGWSVEVHFMEAPHRAQLEELVRVAAGSSAVPHIEFAELPARDWVAASLAELKPVRAGRFAVHGFHDRDKVLPNLFGIEIEAALAFGTGHHGTTLGCLRAIGRAAHGRRPRRILDVGAGTGVLAIAAALALRCPVVAGEIDPRSVRVARANVQANRAAAFVRVVEAAGVVHPAIRAAAPYDFVVANILLSPLLRLARPVRALLAPGAVVVLSGLLAEQANAALAAWRAQGLALRRREIIDNWATLTLVYPGPHQRS